MSPTIACAFAVDFTEKDRECLFACLFVCERAPDTVWFEAFPFDKWARVKGCVLCLVVSHWL